jgi:C_GCAxxG_C_C family probable redox protein
VLTFLKARLKKPANRAGAAAGASAELARLAADRAENLFRNRGLNCAEAVLLVVNRAFGGELSVEACLGLGSGFGGGIGNSGCTCGSLSGAVMALGLFLGPAQAEGLGKKEFRRLVGALHDRFRERSGSVCCRELIADLRQRPKGRRLFCQDLTGWVAAETVRLILAARPGLAEVADREFLVAEDSRFSAVLDRLTGGASLASLAAKEGEA